MHLASQPLSPLLLGASCLFPGQGKDADSGESRYSAIQPNSVGSPSFVLSTYSAILCRHMRPDMASDLSLIDWLCSQSSNISVSVANTGCLTHVTGHGALFRRLDHRSRCREPGHLSSMRFSSERSVSIRFSR